MFNIDAVVAQQYDRLTRGAYPASEVSQGGIVTPAAIMDKLYDSLRTEKGLIIYCGYDPTNDTFTVGHLPTLRKLKIAEELGHNPRLIIGTATVLAGGDPTDTAKARSMLQLEKVQHNAKSLTSQARRILGKDIPILDNYQDILSKLSYV